jgi:hypothetical protein
MESSGPKGWNLALKQGPASRSKGLISAHYLHETDFLSLIDLKDFFGKKNQNKT